MLELIKTNHEIYKEFKGELRHDEDWTKDGDTITFTCGIIVGEDEDTVDYEEGYWNINGER